MTDKEIKYADSLFAQLRRILEKLLLTQRIEFENKEIVLEDMKSIINARINELHYEDLLG